MSLIDLNRMLCIPFEFKLSDAEVEEEILATMCYLVCNVHNLVFLGYRAVFTKFRDSKW